MADMTDPMQQLQLMNDPERQAALAPLLKLWGTGGRNEQLQQQMAMAQALRRPNMTNYGTAGGNIASGIGNALGNLAGGLQQHQLQGQMDQNQAQLEDPSFFNNPLAQQLMFSQLLKKQQQPPTADAGMPDLSGLSNGMG